MRPHWIILHLGRTTINTHNNQPDVGLEWQSWFVYLDVDEGMNVCCLVSLLLFVWKTSVCWSSNQVTDITIYHERKRNNTHNQRNNHHDEQGTFVALLVSSHIKKPRVMVQVASACICLFLLNALSSEDLTHHHHPSPTEWSTNWMS